MFRRSGYHFCDKNMPGKASRREFLSSGQLRPNGKRAVASQPRRYSGNLFNLCSFELLSGAGLASDAARADCSSIGLTEKRIPLFGPML